MKRLLCLLFGHKPRTLVYLPKGSVFSFDQNGKAVYANPVGAGVCLRCKKGLIL